MRSRKELTGTPFDRALRSYSRDKDIVTNHGPCQVQDRELTEYPRTNVALASRNFSLNSCFPFGARYSSEVISRYGSTDGRISSHSQLSLYNSKCCMKLLKSPETDLIFISTRSFHSKIPPVNQKHTISQDDTQRVRRANNYSPFLMSNCACHSALNNSSESPLLNASTMEGNGR